MSSSPYKWRPREVGAILGRAWFNSLTAYGNIGVSTSPFCAAASTFFRKPSRRSTRPSRTWINSILSIRMQQLSQWLHDRLGDNVETDVARDEMLVTLQLPAGRRQTVKVTVFASRFANGIVLRLRSRAFLPRNPKDIAGALRANNEISLAGFLLDSEDSTYVVETTYTLVEPIDSDEFVIALEHVAQLADSLEQRAGGEDVF
jgi:hypothetical protein